MTTFTPKDVPLETRVNMIRHAVAEAKEGHHRNNWIEADADGFTGWRWEKYNVQLKIVCAANRYGELIVLGTRHGAPSMYYLLDLVGDDAITAYCQDDREQGFIDQYGVFRSRKEAMEICKKNGTELSDRGGSNTLLFSEHLY